MVGNIVAQFQSAEPPVSKVQVNLFTQTVFRPNAEAISHQQHADEEFSVNPLSCIFNALPGNGMTACMAVEIGEMLADARQVDKPINGSQQMILRNVIVYRELVKQCASCLGPNIEITPRC